MAHVNSIGFAGEALHFRAKPIPLLHSYALRS